MFYLVCFANFRRNVCLPLMLSWVLVGESARGGPKILQSMWLKTHIASEWLESRSFIGMELLYFLCVSRYQN